MAYLLDADVFISAKNLHYGLDFCPAFWDWVIAQHAAGRVFSIEKVENQLQEGADELWTWASALPNGFFIKADADVAASLAAVSAWATSQQYDQAAVNTFLQDADYYLVSQALAGGHTVVTQEVSAPDSKRVIKVPDACTGVGVPCMNVFEMLRIEGARFVLG